MLNKMMKFAPILSSLALIISCSMPLGSSDKATTPTTTLPERVSTLVINPTSGKANDQLDVSGSGFHSGEKILLLLTAEGLVKGKSIGTLTIGLAAEKSGGVVTADEKGTFKLSRKFPVNIKPGVHTLEARGDKGSKATCPIEILGK